MRTLHTFTGSPSDGYIPNGLSIGQDGVLYGTTQAGGSGSCVDSYSGCGTVFSLTPPTSPGGGLDRGCAAQFRSRQRRRLALRHSGDRPWTRRSPGALRHHPLWRDGSMCRGPFLRVRDGILVDRASFSRHVDRRGAVQLHGRSRRWYVSLRGSCDRERTQRAPRALRHDCRRKHHFRRKFQRGYGVLLNSAGVSRRRMDRSVVVHSPGRLRQRGS
jgi:hypothetical protein